MGATNLESKVAMYIKVENWLTFQFSHSFVIASLELTPVYEEIGTSILAPVQYQKVGENRYLSTQECTIYGLTIQLKGMGLPWWCSGWESACQCRGHGFEPWSGKIPHTAEQLGPWATITEPARLEPVLRNKRGRDSERPVHRNGEWPPLATTRESPHTETKTQHSHKLIN